MITGLTEITGREVRDGNDAINALIGFYRAFNARDLEGLEGNWEQGDAPSMDNPMGGIRRGWPSIRDGYLKLFAGPAVVQVTFHDFTSQGGEDWHLFVGREIGTCVTPDMKMEVRFRTTRWFTRRDGTWRQLHHHGSIEEPKMLAAYQRTILGAPLGEAA
jgi:hypothetical protein